jgi:hypothetical protein
MSRIHIFRAGQHTDMAGVSRSFSEADLAASAQAYDPELHEAPIVIGHPKLDAPAYGWVKSLSADAEGLHAEDHQVDPQFAEIVGAGRYKKVSAAFFAPDAKRNPVPGVWYLRHVGFLGATPPAVKGLRNAQFAADDDEVVEIEFSDGDGGDDALFERFRQWLFRRFPAADRAAFAEALSTRAWSGDASRYKDAGAYCAACLVDENESGKPKIEAKCHLPVREPSGAVNRHALMTAQGALVGARGGVDLPDAVKRAAARKLIGIMHDHKITPSESLTSLAGGGSADHSEGDTMTKEELEAREAELKKQADAQAKKDAEFAEREKAIADQEAATRRKGITEYVGGLVKAGKILPRDEAGLVAYMSGPNEAGVIEFAEEGTAKKEQADAWLRKFLDGLPQQVEYAEVSAREKDDTGTASFAAPAGYTVDPRGLELHNKALAYQRAHPKTDYDAAVAAVSR